MASHPVDLATWPRAAQFRFFRNYDRPHYAVTARLDVTAVMARKAAGLSPYRACLHAIGAGIHAVPELCMRFRGDDVVRHDMITLSMTVPTQAGAFGYAYVPFVADFGRFDAQAKALIARTAAGADLAPNDGERDDLAYLSCMPWLDYTAISNAMPGPQDCIPRVTWGRIVDQGGCSDMAMTLEVHHALVDGAQLGAYFAAVQGALQAF
ncbi:CatA-like O-acetyltransferase [Yoonia vestfoldensis]|jgi:chloramphenicol O-acetyltransferase type A|uniref:Chloramphenicol acetyltransferase n=1 Tax=Yoonia vestfoldensis TaxID=245188 RepID=A0A1Y0ED46_9RHOB|nr:CatA-like O-acetyltransferase [Yoonia vestfoldensis]ARU01523.1 chloramphenicol acetyltransferase [Yoonia vestfoldensis]